MIRKSPYNPEYGMPDAKREAAMEDARIMPIREAAVIHNIGRSTLYRWRRDYDEPRKTDTPRHGKGPYPGR